jgi:uncharacterized protein
VVAGPFNRRITAGTPMAIRGPVRGSDLVKTKYSPNGTMTRGTINNCAHGYTPWGTYLTCEENWAGYFGNRSSAHRAPCSTLSATWAHDIRRQGDYFARYDARPTGEIIGVIDETVDQKITNNVYTQAGTTLTRRIGPARRVGNAACGQRHRHPAAPRAEPLRRAGTLSRYGWETAESGEDEYVRFDASIKGADRPRTTGTSPTPWDGWWRSIPWDPSQRSAEAHHAGPLRARGRLAGAAAAGPAGRLVHGRRRAERVHLQVRQQGAKYDAKVVEAARTNPALRAR